MLKLLHLKSFDWKIDLLSEATLLFTLVGDYDVSKTIREITEICSRSEEDMILDVIPATNSIAITFNPIEHHPDEIIAHFHYVAEKESIADLKVIEHKIYVCYELGLDWEQVTKKTGLSKDEIIKVHRSGDYTVDMIGFVPGFAYMRGLNKRIHCERKEVPRTRVPAGSIGIGGMYTGIYSLQSPGGWQIIGLSPDSFFDSSKTPPVLLKAGDKIRFIPIGEEEYEMRKAGQNES